MIRYFGVLLASTALIAPARAADKDAAPILDKAIQALGGEPALAKVIASATWNTEGELTYNGDVNPFKTHATTRGSDHLRDEFSGDFGGTEIRGVRVLAGSKGWISMNDNVNEFDADAVAREKHNHFQEIAPIAILPLKSQGVKVEAEGEEAVEGKPAAKVKVTPKDGPDFTIFFDKESGLPLKMVGKAFNWQGEEYSREATFSDYKEMGGIKKATKVVIKRDGSRFIDLTITDFRPLESVPADAFDEPK
ncbi:hypothetical protein TA3x_003313 [Tundrisphaera sp. TA3]|uniref:hypothetical protein n=1 Tax=Tundrisphaera sp. TA3 TaxID=3435775 RepID=UPI003EB7DFD9